MLKAEYERIKALVSKLQRGMEALKQKIMHKKDTRAYVQHCLQVAEGKARPAAEERLR